MIYKHTLIARLKDNLHVGLTWRSTHEHHTTLGLFLVLHAGRWEQYTLKDLLVIVAKKASIKQAITKDLP